MEEFVAEENLPEIYKLIQDTNNKKISRRFPPYQYFENFFCHYVKEGKGKILLTRFQGKIIGGAILGFEKKSTVYCLYYWGKQKRHKILYPTNSPSIGHEDGRRRTGISLFRLHGCGIPS